MLLLTYLAALHFTFSCIGWFHDSYWYIWIWRRNLPPKVIFKRMLQKIDERENGKYMSFMRNLSPFSSILQTKYWQVPSSSFCLCYSKFSCWKPFPKKQRGQRQKAARVLICWKIERKSVKLSMTTLNLLFFLLFCGILSRALS